MAKLKLNMKERAKIAQRDKTRIAFHFSIALTIMLGMFALLVLRYGWIQLVQGDELAARVRHETGEERVMQSPRGAILDRNGREMAVSLMMKSLFIDPNNVLLRGTMYVVAMVLAGVSGIFLMHASQKKNKIDGFRQQAGISREVLEAWQNGEYDEQ